MVHKDDLRKWREGTVINNNSKPMESNMMVAVRNVMSYVRNKFNECPNGCFNRGSIRFRQEKWSGEEVEEIMKDVTCRSLYYYFLKYGEDTFV